MNKLFRHKNASLIASLSAFFVLFLVIFDPWISFWLAAAFLGLYLVYWLMSNSKVRKGTATKKRSKKGVKGSKRRK